MAPHAEPITTVDEIDEAIWWVLMTAPRKIDYMRIVDALLDQRNAASRDAASAPEQRHHSPDQGAHQPAQPHPSADCRETPSSR